MRSHSLPTVFLAALFCLQLCVASKSEAQELRKQIGERHGKPIVNYHPDDPWTRGKVYKLQAGYSGLFFNCDDEECKRYSPYICWKPDNEKMFPTRIGIWGHTKQTIAEVKQRIRDGAGDCARDCNCSKCQSNGQGVVYPQGYVQQNKSTLFNGDFLSLADKERPVSEAEAVNGLTSGSVDAPRFGLIRGKIVDAKTPVTTDVDQAAPPAPQPQVAGRTSFEDYFRNRKKR
jgi:hypothetical protein